LLIPKRKKKKKRKKKGTPPWNVNVGGHPMESVSHGLRKEKGGEECQVYKKSTKVPISLSKTCFIFVWKIVRTPLLVIDKDNHLSKSSFISLFYK
jgi:hypothetical protein